MLGLIINNSKKKGVHAMKVWKKIIAVYTPFRWAMLGLFGYIALGQALNFAAPYLQGMMVDYLIARKPLGTLLALVSVMLTVTAFRAVALSYWQERHETERVDFVIPRAVNRITIEKLLGFSIGQHTNENSGIKQSVMTRGEHSLSAFTSAILYDVFPTAIEIVFLVALLLYYSAILGAIVFSGIALYVWFIARTNIRFRDDFKKMEKLYNENSRFQGEVLRNVGVVLSHAQGKKAVRECGDSLGKAFDFSRESWMRLIVFRAGANSILVLSRFAFIATGIFLVYTGNYTVGQLVMFLAWTSGALGQIDHIGKLHRQLMQMYASIQKYFDMLAIEPDVKVVANPVRPERFAGRIEFKNVTFSYRARHSPEDDAAALLQKDAGKNQALQNISFVIEPGQTVAFVGESGAGKSTLVHLLIRAQDPDEGQIIIDGNDLRVLDLKRFRESVGMVDQDVLLFDQTLRYNIAYGLNGRAKNITDADLDRVAAMACIDRFFPKLENGYDTIIGERGVKLSGGERQRVGIARALIKEPDILVFDEATSNLDSENESLIRKSIERVSQGRTTLIIAHRFSTIKKADTVIVLDKGRVVGQGTHHELKERCEPYQRLLHHQMI